MTARVAPSVSRVRGSGRTAYQLLPWGKGSWDECGLRLRRDWPRMPPHPRMVSFERRGCHAAWSSISGCWAGLPTTG